jgi:transcriptional regulator with XRE-family HTH domain
MTMVENPTWTLAERMVRSRLLAGVDQAVIAERLGVARTTVSAWETGRTEPSATNFVLWAEITGQPIEWLAEGVMCARRDSNPQPSDLYPGDDAIEVEHQLLLLAEAVAA